MQNELHRDLTDERREYERLFCACAFINPTTTLEKCSWLEPNDFLDKEYGEFWKGMKDHGDSMRAASEANLLVELSGYATELTSSMFPEYYAGEMKKIEYLWEASGAIGEIAVAISQRDENTVRDKVAKLHTADPALHPWLHDIQKPSEIGEEFVRLIQAQTPSLLTGIDELDCILGGLFMGELTIVAGRPGIGKCLGEGTRVVMADGRLKKVEDIVVGDRIMGADSKERIVLSLARGVGNLYRVRQNHGIDYVVNESHILSLKRSKSEGNHKHGDVLNISIRDILNKGSGFYGRYKGYKIGIELTEIETTLEPYFLGLWLGDGTSTNAHITCNDSEVVDYLRQYAERRQEYVVIRGAHSGRCPQYLITGGRSRSAREHSVHAELSGMNLIGNKHIPERYLYNSRRKRLELLAGLIDSDGYYPRGLNGPFEITQKNKLLAEQIRFLCDSLGYRTTMTSKEASCQTGSRGIVYRITFNGNVDEIPTKIGRKKARPWKSKLSWQMTGIQIEPMGIGKYYGFELDGDGLFLLEDMTVTHNTSIATAIAQNIATANLDSKVLFFSLEMDKLQLWARMACAKTSHSWQEIRAGRSDLSAIKEVEQASIDLQVELGDRLLIEDSVWDVPSMISICAEVRPSLVVIDHLSEIRWKDDNAEEVKWFGRATKILRTEIARRMHTPVILLHQLNRAIEGKDNKRPVLSNLKWSGDLEAIADTVLMLYRDDYYEDDKSQKPQVVPMEVWIKKNRQGVMNACAVVNFDTKTQKFSKATSVTRMPAVEKRDKWYDMD